MIASALVLSLEEERKRKAIPNKKEIMVEAQERLHQEKAEEMKALEDQIRMMGDLQ